MQSLLDVIPKFTGIPTLALANADKELKKAAETAELQQKMEIQRRIREAPPQSDFRLKYYLKLGLFEPTPISAAQFKGAVIEMMKSEWGSLKGPCSDAVSSMDDFVARAQKAGYPLYDKTVQKKFLYFMMAFVTAGFQGSETGGTTIGNFQGEWRGGGFINYTKK